MLKVKWRPELSPPCDGCCVFASQPADKAGPPTARAGPAADKAGGNKGVLRKAPLCVIFCICALCVSAQVKDTTVKHHYDEVTFFTLNDPHLTLQFDSSLTDFHLYPLFRRGDPFAEAIGNTGLPVVSPRMVWRRPLGVDAGFHAHDAYLYHHNSIPFYNPPFPFSSLEYVQGLGGEQQLHALHSQNIRGRVNLGADYRLLGSRGFYDRQMTNIDNLHLFAGVRTKSRRYGVLASFLLNDVENETNGGVAQFHRDNPDSLFSLPLKSQATMRNTTASMKQNEKELTLYQHLDFGKKFSVPVSEGKDTSLFYPKLRLFHRLAWGQMTYQYNDPEPDSGYYAHFFLRTDSTFDSMRHITFQNSVGIELPRNRSQVARTTNYSPIAGKAWVKYSVDHLSQEGNAFYYSNTHAGLRLESQPGLSLPLGFLVLGEGFLSGPMAGDVQAYGIVSGKIRQSQVDATGSLMRRSPAFIHERYLGNHRRWDTTLLKETISLFSVSFRMLNQNLLVTASYQSNAHQLYFDSTGNPAQAGAPTRVRSLEARHIVRLRTLRFHNHILLQSAKPNTVIDLPLWSSRHALYFEGSIFKKALFLQAGVDVRFHSAWYAPAFDPITTQFLVQRSRLVSSLPVTDIFLNMRVKKARVFLMVSDVTEGLVAPGGYFGVPGHPAGGRTFRFGVSWQFFD